MKTILAPLPSFVQRAANVVKLAWARRKIVTLEAERDDLRRFNSDMKKRYDDLRTLYEQTSDKLELVRALGVDPTADGYVVFNFPAIVANMNHDDQCEVHREVTTRLLTGNGATP